jgi:hypothetical protein
MDDAFAHRGGPNAALSSMASANNRFNLPFSSSNDRSRCASKTLMPPNLAFQA